MRKYVKIILVAVTSVLLMTSTYLVMDVNARSYGGSRSGGFRSAPRATVKPAAPKVTTTPKVTAPKVASRPSASTSRVVNSSTKKVGGKTYSNKGNIIDKNYQPKFSGGYRPPEGSVVYYRNNTFLDYLPLYFILTHGSHREAVVVEKGSNGAPDKETVVKEEGVDTMYVCNWIVTVLFGLGLIGLVYWLIARRRKS